MNSYNQTTVTWQMTTGHTGLVECLDPVLSCCNVSDRYNGVRNRRDRCRPAGLLLPGFSIGSLPTLGLRQKACRRDVCVHDPDMNVVHDSDCIRERHISVNSYVKSLQRSKCSFILSMESFLYYFSLMTAWSQTT